MHVVIRWLSDRMYNWTAGNRENQNSDFLKRGGYVCLAIIWCVLRRQLEPRISFLLWLSKKKKSFHSLDLLSQAPSGSELDITFGTLQCTDNVGTVTACTEQASAVDGGNNCLRAVTNVSWKYEYQDVFFKSFFWRLRLLIKLQLEPGE